MKTRPEYREATKEGKPKKHDGSVGSRCKCERWIPSTEDDPGDGQEAGFKAITWISGLSDGLHEWFAVDRQNGCKGIAS